MTAKRQAELANALYSDLRAIRTQINVEYKLNGLIEHYRCAEERMTADGLFAHCTLLMEHPGPHSAAEGTVTW